jgi:prepilin-type N-terminal cleavage/methylation domain-containing protein
MKRRLKSGFTLIEILVVVVIILVLSGVLFRISSLVSYKASVAKAVSDMEKIRNALEEYYAEYGIYPPTTDNAYIYENANWQFSVMRTYIQQNQGSISDSEESAAMEGNTDHIGYQYGLVSHLFFRQRGVTSVPAADQGDYVVSQQLPYSEDTERDLAAKRRWAHYLEGIGLEEAGNDWMKSQIEYDANLNISGVGSPSFPGPALSGAASGQVYFNAMAVLVDPWGGELKYESRPPFQSYELWSTTLGRE